jgi:hypothetical protein
MKTSKIITTIAALNLIFFMSVSSIANPLTTKTGDIVKKSANKKIEVVKTKIVDLASSVSSENEFSHLRFDVNKFNTESGVVELPVNSLDYLRFDARNYTDGTGSEITDLPVMNEFSYLRFDVANFNNTSDFNEMPVNEYDYLRFDVNNYSNVNSFDINELPVN